MTTRSTDELEDDAPLLLCQACGAPNSSARELCGKCHQKLFVLSGLDPEEGPAMVGDSSGDFSLDEHLLERVSILEEAFKRTAETLGKLVSAVHKQEKNLLVSQTGFATLRELLERRNLLGAEEWGALWRTNMEQQLRALDKRERYAAVKERIAALYQGTRKKLFVAQLDEAEEALVALDLDRARRSLEQAYRLDRENDELALFLGETAFDEGELDEALVFFRRVLDKRSDQFEALVYSGVIHHERGDERKAEQHLRHAVALFPDAFLPQFSLGAVFAAQGELGRAILYLERACELEPVPQALYLLGNCLYESGKRHESVRVLSEAVRLDPGFEEAHYLLGVACLDLSWNRKALAAFREAQRLNPRRMRYQDLVRFLSGSSRAPLPPVGSDAKELMAKAEALVTAGESERALALYQRALQLEPENATLHMSYALVCLSLDRTDELERSARKVIDLDAGEMLSTTASAALIAALRSRGNFREGNRLGRALLETGKSSFARTIAYYEMAYNLAEMEEDLDQALDYARKSLELAPEELKQFPLAALGWVYYKRKEFAQAIDSLEKSNALGSSPTTLTHLGMALLAAGEEERARGAFGRARHLEPRVGALEETMMECLRDSARLIERASRKPKR